ncbi:unnamed protein product, partial [Laminaria digitata]
AAATAAAATATADAKAAADAKTAADITSVQLGQETATLRSQVTAADKQKSSLRAKIAALVERANKDGVRAAEEARAGHKKALQRLRQELVAKGHAKLQQA